MNAAATTTRAPVLETYARTDLTFVRGEGAWLEGDDGKRYLDLVGGIAVVGLGADKLLFVTDVPGLLDGGVVVPVIDAEEAGKLLDAGAFEGGIIPKLRAATTAARDGVPAAIGRTAVTA